MIIIHQRKSAGTALTAALQRDLGLRVSTDSEVNVFNSIGKRLFDEIQKYESYGSEIRSFHLHPTRSNYNFIVRKRIKAIVLLRNPYTSYQSLFDHRQLDGAFIVHNIASTYKDSKRILVEFNEVWRTLVGRDHLLFLSYDQIVSHYPEVLLNICKFYNISPAMDSESVPDLPKVRWSGKIHDGKLVTDLSKTNISYRLPLQSPDFQYINIVKSIARKIMPRILYDKMKRDRSKSALM